MCAELTAGVHKKNGLVCCELCNEYEKRGQIAMKKKGKVASYNRWGYIFLLPFFLVYGVFQMVPLFSTIYYSFQECYRSGLKQIGPEFVGLKNYITLLTNGDFLTYFKNTKPNTTFL